MTGSHRSSGCRFVWGLAFACAVACGRSELFDGATGPLGMSSAGAGDPSAVADPSTPDNSVDGGATAYRNDIREVARFFATRHYGHFLIFNLCEEHEEGGNGNYDTGLLYEQVRGPD